MIGNDTRQRCQREARQGGSQTADPFEVFQARRDTESVLAELKKVSDDDRAIFEQDT